MKRLTIILGLLLAGCQGPQPQKPVWQDIKFKELAAARHTGAARNPLEPPFQFNVYIFNVPPGNFGLAKTSWTNLSKKQISFRNQDAFRQNGFEAGLGQGSEWPQIAEKLHQAQGKTIKTIDLIMANNATEEIPVSQLGAEKNIFYKSSKGQVSGATVGPGKAVLRLTAATIPDMRGVCKLTVEPAFIGSAKLQIGAAGPEAITFDSPITAKISQGDFLLLGPASASQEMALGNLFFSSPDKTAMQMYLIFCLKVND